MLDNLNSTLKLFCSPLCMENDGRVVVANVVDRKGSRKVTRTFLVTVGSCT